MVRLPQELDLKRSRKEESNLNTENYTKKFSGDESKVIAIDFDGVIHDNSLGYHDGTIYGLPIEGALQSIENLSDMGYLIKVFTCKCHPDRPLVDSKTGTELVSEWLESHGIMKYVEEVVWGKPHAALYIDDKGYRFENWENTLAFMEKIK